MSTGTDAATGRGSPAHPEPPRGASSGPASGRRDVPRSVGHLVLRPVLVAVSRYWTVAALIAAWVLWIRVENLNQIVAPTPAAVFGDVLGHPGVYAADLGWTLLNSAVGLGLGMALGTALAVAVWASPVLSGLMTPMALIMRSVPVVAMIPVIAQVVGFGDTAVLAVTVVVSFFPAFVMAGSGLRSAPASVGDVFTVLNASRTTRLRLLLLPHAVGPLLVALRLTAPTTVLAAMLAEYLLGTHGLGKLFADSITFMDTARAWGTALVATVVSVACFVAARAAERHGTARFS